MATFQEHILLLVGKIDLLGHSALALQGRTAI